MVCLDDGAVDIWTASPSASEPLNTSNRKAQRPESVQRRSCRRPTSTCRNPLVDRTTFSCHGRSIRHRPAHTGGPEAADRCRDPGSPRMHQGALIPHRSSGLESTSRLSENDLESFLGPKEKIIRQYIIQNIILVITGVMIKRVIQFNN